MPAALSRLQLDHLARIMFFSEPDDFLGADEILRSVTDRFENSYLAGRFTTQTPLQQDLSQFRWRI